MDTIRVMIVDDHDVVRRGLAVFLRAFDDLELVAEAANGAEAIELCPKVNPHVVLLDLMMPEMDGIAATRIITERFPHIRVVALTSRKDEYSVEAMMSAGAIGYLLKNASVEELANTILSAAATPIA